MWPSRSLRFPTGACLAALVVTGCHYVSYEARTLSPEKSAAAFDARSLENADLHRFLGKNLGRDFSKSPAAWDFETLNWVAFYYHPSLDVARAQWASASAGLTTAGARPNPTISVTPGYSTNPGAGVSPWFPALAFDLPIETAGKRDRRLESARLTAEVARQSVFTVVWKVRSDLRRALLELSTAGPRAKQLRTQADVQQRIAALLEKRLAAGALSAPEVAPARLAALRAEALASEAERQGPLARQHLATALGLPVSALEGVTLLAPPLNAPLSPGQLAEARGRALRSRSDVLAALARYNASEAALALEVAKQYPDIHLGPGYQWDQGQDKWTLGLSLELPLFAHNQGPVAEAEARRHEAAAEFLAVQAQVIAEVDAAALAQTGAAAQVEALRRMQAQLGQQHARSESRHRAGAADQLEQANGELEFETGELGLSEARAAAALAAGQLEDALQIPFPSLHALENSANVPSS